MSYAIVVSPTALRMLQGIKDRRVRAKLSDRIDELAVEPEKQGKPLIGELAGLRSVRAVGQRYRIIFRVDGRRVVVLVLALGIRKEGARDDIYRLAKSLIELRLIEPPH